MTNCTGDEEAGLVVLELGQQNVNSKLEYLTYTAFGIVVVVVTVAVEVDVTVTAVFKLIGAFVMLKNCPLPRFIISFTLKN
jgi:hypothetical protein